MKPQSADVPMHSDAGLSAYRDRRTVLTATLPLMMIWRLFFVKRAGLIPTSAPSA